MKLTRLVTYRVESMIPGIKSWGWLPEEGAVTLKRAREIVANYRRYPSTRIRVTKTTTMTRRVKL